MKLKVLAALAGAACIAVPVAWAAGMFSTLPMVGQPAFCASTIGAGPIQGTVTGTGVTVAAPGATGLPLCQHTVPAGPTQLTGNEIIPGDTNLAGGASPQTVAVPSSALVATAAGAAGNRNAIIGGDFATNLFQRGTTFTTLTPSTAVMTADRWYTFSSGNTVTLTKQTGASDTIPAAGLLASFRVNRPSGTNTTPICIGQVLDAKAAERFLGNVATFSFWELANTGYLATANNIVVTIAYYTAADSATPFTNTATFATATTTGYTAAVSAVWPSNVASTATIASGAATIPTTNTWTRYAVSASIPVTNAAGTQITGIGVSICTPTYPASTGTANDWFEVAGAQLEAQLGTAIGPNSAIPVMPGVFERRTQALESELAQYYTTGGGLGAETNGTFYQAGGCVASGNANFGIIFPVPMRVAPTAATSTLTAGGYSIQTAAAVTAIGTITFATSTVYNLTLNSNAACTSTLPYQLKGTNTTGLILFSAEP